MHRTLEVLVRAQHGVVARVQLLEAGLGASGVKSWLARGRLHRVYPGVYAYGRAQLSREGRWMGAVLAVGPGAVISHGDAAALWGISERPSGPIHLTVPRLGRHPRGRGLAVHRVPLHDQTTSRRRVPTTTPQRTIIDLAPTLSRRHLERAIDEASYLNLLSPSSLAAAVRANKGRQGAAAVRALLETHTPGTTRTRSHLEELFLDLCARANLPRPQVNQRVAGIEVDFLWRSERVIVETDGYAAHRSRAAFERDHRRDTALQDADYAVRRFTYRQITEDSAAVVATVRAALRD